MPIVLTFGPNLQLSGGLNVGVNMTHSSFTDLLASSAPGFSDEVKLATASQFQVGPSGSPAAGFFFGSFTYPPGSLIPNTTSKLTGMEYHDAFTAGQPLFYSLSSLPNLPFDALTFDPLEAYQSLKDGGINIGGTNFNDLLLGGTGRDVLSGNGGIDTLRGGAGNDRLLGGDGDSGGPETLNGGRGDDTLDGGTGSGAVLTGGLGNDTYIIRYYGGIDAVVEEADGGFDTVIWWGSSWGGSGPAALTVPSNIERVLIDPHSAVISEGNPGFAVSATGANSLKELVGGPGPDQLTGPNIGGAVLSGAGGNDSIFGIHANDTLNGGSGADFMRGNRGDDVYIVDNPGDIIWEFDLARDNWDYTGSGPEPVTVHATESFSYTVLDLDTFVGFYEVAADENGTDTVKASISYTIPNSLYVFENASSGFFPVNQAPIGLATAAIIENLTLTGSANINGTGNNLDNVIIGNSGHNTLRGKDGSDRISGNAGDDDLFGGAGDDDLRGGLGADLLVGANGNDVLLGAKGIDTLNGGDGNDSVFGAPGGDVVEGNNGDDFLLGEDGNDVVVGGLGMDHMEGGAGNDTMTGEDGDDTVIGGDGFDGLFGGRGDDDLRGGLQGDVLSAGQGNDVLFGGRGQDVLKAGDGDDTLHPGLGNDTLTGGAGNDDFIFESTPGQGNVDVLPDFGTGADRIVLDRAVFTALGEAVTADNFGSGASFADIDADDRLFYNTVTGNLYYDSDGQGGAAPVSFAVLTGTPDLGPDDFHLI